MRSVSISRGRVWVSAALCVRKCYLLAFVVSFHVFNVSGIALDGVPSSTFIDSLVFAVFGLFSSTNLWLAHEKQDRDDEQKLTRKL